ncbi:MAG: queuosine precursor transporter [Bacteroidota bacterium]
MTDHKQDHLHRRDVLFLSLAGIFLTSLVLGNVIGTTKFVTIFELTLPGWLQRITPSLVRDGSTYMMSVPAGVIAYPFTFLATDLISELFGRKKAQLVVWVGLGMNFFMLLLMSINHWLPNSAGISGGLELFDGVYEFMIGNTIASMIAYLIAQTVDVRLFHFWKKKTKGKHLWLRNNGSTMFSQLVDSTAILTILYLAGNLGDAVTGIGALIVLIINSYLFKFFFALFDTPLFYLGVKLLHRFEEDPEGNALHTVVEGDE